MAPGGGRAAVLGRASLVEEVGLEGGRQRQGGDGTQALLPQGQAHRATAEIHERQGLGWEGPERELEVSDSISTHEATFTPARCDEWTASLLSNSK